MNQPDKTWTYDMYQKLLDEFPTKGTSFMAEFGVSLTSLYDKAARIGVRQYSPPTDREKELLRKYADKLGTAMVFILPDRVPAEIGMLLCEN